MSEKLISRNPDLQRLRNEGYEVEVRDGYLIIHSIPYVTSKSQVALGLVVTNLTLSGDVTQRPSDHQVWFAGEFPCKHDGKPIDAIRHTSANRTLCTGLEVNHHFSNKPPEGYADYYEKVTRYIEIISSQAKAIDPTADARTFKPIESPEGDSVFLYTDSASARANIVMVSKKLAMNKIAIVGLGGTGAYTLDLVAKTPAREIHLFDGDVFLQHNAFRAPGAASIAVLNAKPSKVTYWASNYGQMRRGIVPHELFLDEANIGELSDFDFVFVCVDKPAVRKLVADFLVSRKIPFIDVGMELEVLEDQQCLIGACRATLATSEMSKHFSRHVCTDGTPGDGIYRSNIQVADLNALNAAMAVIKWKKLCGFYQDCYQEHQSVYVVNTHQLTRDETTGSSST